MRTNNISISKNYLFHQLNANSFSNGIIRSRHFSTTNKVLAVKEENKQSKSEGEEELATAKSVGYWYLTVASMVFVIVVIGGITRLTESGLSITEWNLIRGIKKPSSEEEWIREFEEYKKYPEFKKLKPNMTLEEFKNIYYYEWLHRNIGRFIGLSFILPAIYFASKGKLSPYYKKRTFIIASLIGGQGVLGWYMVKSGLDQDLMSGNAIPRVNHKFLASHLLTAISIYFLLVRSGLRILKFHGSPSKLAGLLKDYPGKRMLRGMGAGVTHTLLSTAVVGSLVAGLDAGQIYNQWPHMGDGYIPSDIFEKGPNAMPFLLNFIDNPITVQFEHRCLGYATFILAVALYTATLRRRAVIPRSVFLTGNLVMACISMQVLLGITTLLTGTHVHVAATHQAGSLISLTSLLLFLNLL